MGKKIKITPKMLSQNRLMQKELMRNSELNFKAISRVFKEFGEETEKQFAKGISMQDLKWGVLKSRLETVLSSNSKRSIDNFSKFLNKLFNYNLKDVKIEPVKNKIVDNYAKGLAQKVTNVTETTKKQIATLIDNNKGLNTNEITVLIKEKFQEMSLGRARTIARTETNSMFNNANYMMAQDVGLAYKVWIHGVNSPNERPHHKALSGEKIKLDEYFVLNGVECDGPHADNLDASEVCNCSCILQFTNR